MNQSVIVLYNTIIEQDFDTSVHDTPLKVLQNMFCVTDSKGMRLIKSSSLRLIFV